MAERAQVAFSREMMKRVADRLIESHGHAALAIAALSASRSARVHVMEESRFWLGVCDEIREVRAEAAMIEASAAAVH